MTSKKKDDLETVRDISEALEPFTDEEREKIIRWSRERLGMPKTQGSSNFISSPIIHSPATMSPSNENGPKNIKSFVQEKNPQSDVQFAVVTAYFYRFEATQTEQKETIGAKDLQEAGRQARGYGFKDALKTLNNAVGRGYFNRAGRGEFILNAVGENLVAMVLHGKTEDKGASRKSSSRKKSKKKVR